MAWDLDRRHMLAGLAASLGVASSPRAFAQTRARLVVVGAGFGGATAARTLKRLLPATSVTLIEPNRVFTACPFSNLVIGTDRPLSAQEFGYDTLQADGVNWLQALASDVDAAAKTVTLSDGQKIGYDRLILAPGIDLRWNTLEGYDEAAAERLPHAWKAGSQTALLRDQLHAMEDGGTVIMSVPPAPYRCPPGPYERASLIAHYLKTQKPRSKLIVLDAKDRFSKMPLFQAAWAKHYPDHLEWRSASNDGRVTRVEADTNTLFTDFEALQADVANIIPPQQAGWITERAGVSNATGWCPINPLTFESTLHSHIHVIGDATIATPMPKSAFSANLQAKICALGIARALAGFDPQPTILANTCYSYITPEEAVSITGVYSNADGQLTSRPNSGGLSPLEASLYERAAEAAQAASWFQTITQEAFG